MNLKLKDNMPKLISTPLSLAKIFTQDNMDVNKRGKARHFVNHHSFLMLFRRDFSFNRSWGDFFVDGRLLKFILNFLGVKHTFVQGAVYLSDRLKNSLPDKCFFAVASDASSHSLNNLGYWNTLVLPIISHDNCLEVARRLILEADSRLVILGIGSPNQDILAQNIVMLDEGIEVLCVGAAVEFLANAQKSPPEIVRCLGMEWLWRLVTNFQVTLPRITTSTVGFLLLLIEKKIVR
jgi:hypothetical protein